MLIIRRRFRRDRHRPDAGALRTDRRAPWGGAFLLLVAVAVAGGCQSGNGSARSPLEEGVTLRDLPSYRPPSEPSDDTQAHATPAQTPTVSEKIVARRLVFDRPSQKLALALSMVDEEAVKPSQQRRWRENGFGIGRLDRDRLKLFMANVPQPRAADVYRITNPARYRPLPLVKQDGGTHRLRLIRPDQPAKVIRRTAGEYQLLMKLLPPIDSDSEPVHIDLLPHHYKDLPSLLPESPHDSFLDGKSFDALRLEEPIDTDRVWVVWVRNPPEPQQAEGDTEEDAGEGDDAGDDSPEPSGGGVTGSSGSPRKADGGKRASPGGSVSLAEAMLSGMRDDVPVQMVLLIGVRR